MSAFTPYADDASQATVESLTVDNGTDEVVIGGTLSIPRSREGLDRARRLAALASHIAETLASIPDLPDRIKVKDAGFGTGAPDPFDNDGKPRF